MDVDDRLDRHAASAVLFGGRPAGPAKRRERGVDAVRGALPGAAKSHGDAAHIDMGKRRKPPGHIVGDSAESGAVIEARGTG